MIYTELTKKALKICFDAHKDALDKRGLPYVFHPFHLAESMTDEISVTAALLHDVVEDTSLSFSDLSAMGIPDEVIEVLKLLTHEDGVDYFDYIKKIKNNPTARAVKLADLCHNSDLTRLSPEKIDEWAIKRQEKYLTAISMLTEE
jgi:(p)ppGpp synthase/HD superfamily hydrolase